jgi:molybdopterin/thiamine biosynthesis adenylyltransferase
MNHALLEELLEEHRASSGSSLSESQAREMANRSGLSLREVYRKALEKSCVPLRYARNIGIFGISGQIALLNSRVLLVGCGGLGTWIIEICARAGVGELHLMDGDVFEESNLNRQLYATPANLGSSKAEEAAKRVALINPACKATPFFRRLSEENASRHLSGMDAAVDALDNNTSRRILFEHARQAKVPVIHGAVGGLWGQCGILFPEDPSLLKLFGSSEEEAPDRGVETEKGNPPCTVASVAALQTVLLLKLLTGQKVHPRRYWWLDLQEELVEFLKI